MPGATHCPRAVLSGMHHSFSPLPWGEHRLSTTVDGVAIALKPTRANHSLMVSMDLTGDVFEEDSLNLTAAGATAGGASANLAHQLAKFEREQPLEMFGNKTQVTMVVGNDAINEGIVSNEIFDRFPGLSLEKVLDPFEQLEREFQTHQESFITQELIDIKPPSLFGGSDHNDLRSEPGGSQDDLGEVTLNEVAEIVIEASEMSLDPREEADSETVVTQNSDSGHEESDGVLDEVETSVDDEDDEDNLVTNSDESANSTLKSESGKGHRYRDDSGLFVEGDPSFRSVSYSTSEEREPHHSDW